MLPKCEIDDKFLELFYHELDDHKLESGNSLNLFIPIISNNKFDFDRLQDSLYDIIITYALSRRTQEEIGGLGGRKFKEAVQKLRNSRAIIDEDPDNKEGELGEILLYCFLESHLNAPKIISKLEIKTSANDNVKGSDGIHIKNVAANDYQLIFGESKLYSDLDAGIRKAFGSIKDLIDKSFKDFGFEIGLLNSQLIKESVDDEQYQILKSIIIPNASEDQFNMDKAFGMFIGFQIDDNEFRNLSNSEYRKEVRERVVETVMECIKLINVQIDKEAFRGYPIYIYLLPISNIGSTRVQMINELINK
ncbi:MAG: DUF1837 domain-containing protein [Cytophagales bacterium]|nr:DUF1837 domain-containing protein [Cytophagales bacterium]